MAEVESGGGGKEEKRREGVSQCKNPPRSRAVKCRNGPTLLGGARSRLPCMPTAITACTFCSIENTPSVRESLVCLPERRSILFSSVLIPHVRP